MSWLEIVRLFVGFGVITSIYFIGLRLASSAEIDWLFGETFDKVLPKYIAGWLLVIVDVIIIALVVK